MREGLAVRDVVHDRRGDVIRYLRSGITKSPRSDMFGLESVLAVDGRPSDGRNGGGDSSKDLRPRSAIKRAWNERCRDDFKRRSF